MKNKDFGFLTQHIEKVALGVGGLVLVGVGATQFVLGDPNAVEIDGRTVAPGEIEEIVVRQVTQLDNKLKAPSPIPETVIPAYAEFFAKLYNNAVATDRQLAGIDNTGLAPPWVIEESPEYPKLFLPTPPLATDVIAKSGHGVLASTGGDTFFALQQIIGDAQPADFRYVSAIGTFSFAEMQQRYRAIDKPGEQRIDQGLWRERLAVTSVRLYREEQDPITGEWGDGTVIQPLPGQFGIVPEFQPTLTFEESQELEQRIRASQLEIRRPPFPEISNGPWSPPDVADRKYTPEELQQRDDLQRRIDRLERQLARATGSDPRDAERPSDRGRRGDTRRNQDPSEYGPDFGESFDDGGRDRRRSNRGGDDAADTRRQDREAQRIQKIEDDLLAARTELNELLGVEEDPDLADPANRSPYGGDRGFGGPERFDDRSDFADPGGRRGYDQGFNRGNYGSVPQGDQIPDEIKVWAHDLTVEAGKTYRYKVLVSVMNPLYRFPRLDKTQLAENRNRVAVGPTPEEIDATPWSPSAEVALDPEHYFFVDSANKDQKRADIEVWKVYNGIWRNKEFTETPGNEVGGTAEIDGLDTGGRGIPMFAGPIMLDVDSVPGSRGAPVVRVLFLDPETNRITTRLVDEDKNSTKRKELNLQADLEVKRQQDRLSARE